MSKVKKRIVITLFSVVIVLMLMVFFINKYSDKKMLINEMDSEKIVFIEDVFDIDLPENGEITFYDVEKNNDELVKVNVGMKLNKKDYSHVYQQIKEKYRHSPFLEIGDENFKDKYIIDKEKIEYIYFASKLLLNPDMDIKNSIYERYAYLSQVEDGVFYLIFETG